MFLKVLSLFWFLFGNPFADQNHIHLNQLEISNLIHTSIVMAHENQTGLDLLRTRVMSQKIVYAAQCFDLDPFVLTALIWRESHFIQKSQSETGAVGLTQLTKTAIHEILDQLALRSRRLNPTLRKKVASCYPGFLKSVPETLEKVDFASWKKEVSKSEDLALIFGAALLRVNYKGNYRIALERYNGDPRVKSRFARDVLALSSWIASSFTAIPSTASESSKFLASIQGFSPDSTN